MALSSSSSSSSRQRFALSASVRGGVMIALRRCAHLQRERMNRCGMGHGDLSPIHRPLQLELIPGQKAGSKRSRMKLIQLQLQQLHLARIHGQPSTPRRAKRKALTELR